MPTFRYSAKDQEARMVTGKIDAADLNTAIEEFQMELQRKIGG